MPLKVETVSYVFKNFAPKGKLWSRMDFEIYDQDTESGRPLELEVMVKRSETATLSDYEQMSRKEAIAVLSAALEYLKAQPS